MSTNRSGTAETLVSVNQTRHSGPIRVAVLLDSFAVSGPAKQLLAVAPHIRNAGVDLSCIILRSEQTTSTPYGEAVRAAGVPYREVPFRGKLDRRLLSRARAVLEELDPDVFQTHNYRGTTIAALLKLGRPRWRWLAFYHGATRESLRVHLYHLLDAALLRLADHLVVVSSPQRARFRGPAPPVSVLHNAFLPASECCGPPVRMPEVADGVPRIAVIGRLSHEKGVDLFLRAMRSLMDRGIPVSACIVGDGVSRRALERLNRRLNLEGNVWFVGHIDDIDPIYDWCDLVVVPSRSEGMPNVVLEALQQGRRIVATKVGNIPEILEGSSAAELVPSGNVRALAAGIVRALGRITEPFPDGTVDRIRNRFSLERRVQEHLDLYAHLSSTRDNPGWKGSAAHG